MHAPPLFIAMLAAGAFLGHLYPVFFQFKGGKGVATLIGILFGLSWLQGLGFAATWLLVAGLTRYSSLAALIAASSTPVLALTLGVNKIIVFTLGAMVMILIWRHRGNIAKLMRGEESKIGQKKSEPLA